MKSFSSGTTSSRRDLVKAIPLRAPVKNFFYLIGFVAQQVIVDDNTEERKFQNIFKINKRPKAVLFEVYFKRSHQHRGVDIARFEPRQAGSRVCLDWRSSLHSDQF